MSDDFLHIIVADSFMNIKSYANRFLAANIYYIYYSNNCTIPMDSAVVRVAALDVSHESHFTLSSGH